MNDNQTINVTAQLDTGESAQQIKAGLANIQKSLSPIQVSVKVDTSGATKQLQDIQKQFAAVSASAKAASDSQDSFIKQAQSGGKVMTSTLSAIKTFTSIFPSFDGISTEYALFPQAA